MQCVRWMCSDCIMIMRTRLPWQEMHVGEGITMKMNTHYAHWTWTCTTLMSQGISPSSAMSPRSRLRHCFNVIVLSVMNWTIPNPQGSNMIPSRTRHDVWSLLLLTFCVYICYIYKKGWSIGCLIAGLFLRWVHIHDLRITDQWFGIDYWTHALLVSSNWGSK